MKTILVVGLIDNNLRDRYEATEKEEECKGFEARLRRAFTRHRTPAQEIEEAFSFRRAREDAGSYERKKDSLVEKLLKHQWDRDSLKVELLIHCCNEKEIKREIKMRDCEDAEKITAMMKKFDKVREETEEKWSKQCM